MAFVILGFSPRQGVSKHFVYISNMSKIQNIHAYNYIKAYFFTYKKGASMLSKRQSTMDPAGARFPFSMSLSNSRDPWPEK